MLDVFDFVLGPELYEEICESRQEPIDEVAFKAYVHNLLNIINIDNPEDLAEISCEMHNFLEHIICEWAEKKESLDGYIELMGE